MSEINWHGISNRASPLPWGDKATCCSGHGLEKCSETAVLSLSWKVCVLSNTCLTPCTQFSSLFCAGKDLLDFPSILLNEGETCAGRRRGSCCHVLPEAGLVLKGSQHCTIFHVKWSCFILDPQKGLNQKKTFL